MKRIAQGMLLMGCLVGRCRGPAPTPPSELFSTPGASVENYEKVMTLFVAHQSALSSIRKIICNHIWNLLSFVRAHLRRQSEEANESVFLLLFLFCFRRVFIWS